MSKISAASWTPSDKFITAQKTEIISEIDKRISSLAGKGIGALTVEFRNVQSTMNATRKRLSKGRSKTSVINDATRSQKIALTAIAILIKAMKNHGLGNDRSSAADKWNVPTSGEFDLDESQLRAIDNTPSRQSSSSVQKMIETIKSKEAGRPDRKEAFGFMKAAVSISISDPVLRNYIKSVVSKIDRMDKNTNEILLDGDSVRTANAQADLLRIKCGLDTHPDSQPPQVLLLSVPELMSETFTQAVEQGDEAIKNFFEGAFAHQDGCFEAKADRLIGYIRENASDVEDMGNPIIIDEEDSKSAVVGKYITAFRNEALDRMEAAGKPRDANNEDFDEFYNRDDFANFLDSKHPNIFTVREGANAIDQEYIDSQLEYIFIDDEE